MKYQIFGLLALFCISSTDAVQCYNCLYIQGNNQTDPNCENKLNSSYVSTCPGSKSFTGTTDLPTAGYVQVGDDLTFGVNVKQGNQSMIAMCAKFTGKLSNSSVLARTCGLGDSSYDGKCISDGVYLEVGGRNATDVLGCFCKKDKCNGAQSIQITSFLSISAFVFAFISKIFV